MRVVGVLSTLILVLALPTLGITQGMVQPTMPGPAAYSAPSTGFFPGPGSFGDFDVAGITVTPSARIGYQKLGMNINLPLNNGWALDLKLENSDMWVWGIGLMVNLTDNVAIFWSGDLSAGKRVTIRTEEEPYNAGARAVQWTGSNLQWGTSEVGAILRVWEGAYLIGGVKMDRVLMRLSDPRDLFGPINGGYGFLFDVVFTLPIIGDVTIGAAAAGDQEYYADFQTTTWMPYLGVGLAGPNYKWCLIGTPFAWVDARIPLRYGANNAATGEISGTTFGIPWLAGVLGQASYEDELRYTFNRTGYFLESDFEYTQNVAPNFSLGIWCKGTWMKFRGTGTGGWSASEGEGLSVYYQVGALSGEIPLYNNQINASDSDSARGMVTRFDYAGGLTALLSF
ncbi:MAG: hypothetical protein P8182_11995 [Deltaproteobacteria bacterium]